MIPETLKRSLESRIAAVEHPRELAVDVMMDLQTHHGWLNDEAVEDTAQLLGITPMEVAETLDGLAGQVLAGVQSLRSKSDLTTESASTITDMESMAYLGRYYADKIRGAADLAVYRADKSRARHRQRAVRHLENAVGEWQAYTRIATSQYKPQLLSRTNYLDWEELLIDVRKEWEAVSAER